VTKHASGDVAVFDVGSRQPRARLAVGASPHHVAFARDGTRAYVVGEAAGELVEVEVALGPSLGRTPVGRRPYAVLPVETGRLGRCRPGHGDAGVRRRLVRQPALFYNAFGVPIAPGLLYPSTGVL
jgi:hypothetical protein